MAASSATLRASVSATLCGVAAAVISSCAAPSPGAITAAQSARPGATGPATTAHPTISPPTIVTGSAGWRDSTLPALPSGTHLTGGAAVSAQDAWTVGWSGAGSYKPVVLHWDGRSWSLASVAGIRDMVALGSVVATGTGQVWVSGSALTPVLGSMATTGVVYRLEGSRWVSVPMPTGLDPGRLYNGPDGQIWMTGSNIATAGANNGAPVIASWTGQEWRVSYTAPGNAYYNLQSLEFVTARDGWAAGYTQATAPQCFYSLHQCQDGSDKSPLLLHWDGTSWRPEAPPRVPTDYPGGGALSSVAATPASAEMWAAGTVFGQAPTFVGESWLLHWNGKSWATATKPIVSVQGQYLYHLEGRWISASGVITPSWSSIVADGTQVVAIPGTTATWVIGTSSGQDATATPPSITSTPFIAYSSGST